MIAYLDQLKSIYASLGLCQVRVFFLLAFAYLQDLHQQMMQGLDNKLLILLLDFEKSPKIENAGLDCHFSSFHILHDPKTLGALVMLAIFNESVVIGFATFLLSQPQKLPGYPKFPSRKYIESSKEVDFHGCNNVEVPIVELRSEIGVDEPAETTAFAELLPEAPM